MFLIKWLWKNMYGNRATYIIAILMALAAQSMFIINPYIRQQIIDTFIDNPNAAENLVQQKNLLIQFILAMSGFTMLRTGLHFCGTMLFEHSSQGLLYRVRAFLYDNMQGEDANFYDRYRTGDIMTRLSGDLEMVRHSVAWVIKQLIENAVLFSVTAIYFFILDPLMAVCILSMTPVIFFISFLFRRKVRPMFINLRERLAELSTSAEENISGNRVIKAFARGDYEIKRFGQKNKEYKEANEKAALMWMKFFPWLESSASGLMVIQLLAGGLFVIGGRLTIGEFSVFMALIWTVSNPMKMLGNIINDLQRFTASANKIIEVYYGRPKIVDRADAVSLKGRINGEIEFKNVSFSYDGERKVLNNVSFDGHPGQSIAIVGPTGAGKTTIVNLLSRFYNIEEGQVLIDGQDIMKVTLRSLRSQMGIML
ncbi:MAG: ABC transporter transmembrane domain-containing protein, partial [Oscillospiraceae bacterium]|nr:ABC transporter transmembrane domain-containing protein [Oscillospiraceae bacterium]